MANDLNTIILSASESECKSFKGLQRIFAFLCAALSATGLTNIMQTISHLSSYGAGGRISSPQHRYSQEICEDFTGLEQDTKRYDLLLLVKRAGKILGFTPRMIELLDYYMAFTRDIDWQEGARPIVYQSLSKTALDLGVSERHIQRLEQKLFEIGAITWNDSGNHRRYGQRHPQTGQILYAYGVDLTPLAYLQVTLQEKLHEKQLYDQAWMETKRQISWYRRQMRAMLAELLHENTETTVGQGALTNAAKQYEAIAKPIRTYLSLKQLHILRDEHKAHYEHIKSHIKIEKTRKESSNDDSNVVNYKSTTHKQSNKLDTDSRPKMAKGFQKGCSNTPRSKGACLEVTDTGLQHITVKQVLNAASERFRGYIPHQNRALDWHDLVEAADNTRKELWISHEFWGEACQQLGRAGATVCVMLTDQATLRENDPVLRPPAYFKAMINRAEKGELRLHNAIFGLLKREDSHES